MKNVPYDPVKDFTPIARRQPALHPGRQPQTALENGRRPGHRCAPAPRRITYASGNSTGIVAGATLARRAISTSCTCPIRHAAGPDRRGRRTGGFHVHRPGFRPALRAVRPVAGAGGVHRAAQRHRPRPASMAESGVPDFDLNSWNGYFGPAGLPPEVVARLNAAINQVVASRDPPAPGRAGLRRVLGHAAGLRPLRGRAARPVGQADPRCRDRAAMSPHPPLPPPARWPACASWTSARSSWAPTPPRCWATWARTW